LNVGFGFLLKNDLCKLKTSLPELLNGDTIMPDDPEIHKLIEASYEVKKN
jgi:hypothetical protein